MFHNLLKNIYSKRMKVDGTLYQKAAGTTDTLTSDAFDMLTAGAQDVVFETALGAITATGTIAIKLVGSVDSAFTVPVDLTGATQSVVAADAQTVVAIEVYKPGFRYIRQVSVRATANSAVDSVIARGIGIAHRVASTDATYKAPVFVNNP